MSDKTLTAESEITEIETLRQERDRLQARVEEQEKWLKTMFEGLGFCTGLFLLLWIADLFPRSPLLKRH